MCPDESPQYLKIFYILYLWDLKTEYLVKFKRIYVCEPGAKGMHTNKNLRILYQLKAIKNKVKKFVEKNCTSKSTLHFATNLNKLLIYNY